MAKDDEVASSEDRDGEQRPERDRFGLLTDRPWYRHPFVMLTAAGLLLLLLTLYMAETRTAGVPLFG